MLELGSSGSVRGVSSNGHPYRDPGPEAVVPWPDRAQKNTFIPAAQKVPDGSCSGVIEKIFPSAPYLERRGRRRRARGVERGWSW